VEYSGAGVAGMQEKTLSTTTAFSGRLLKVEVVEVELESGARSRREVVRHPGAVAILAELPDGRFVLVRQFRKAIEQDLLEVVAGTLDKGEDPDDCARRELREETGYSPETLTRLGAVFVAPGYSQEMLHVYHARLNPTPGCLSPDDDEKLEVVCLTAAQLEQMMKAGEIADAKTLAAWLLYVKRCS
jgi:ADP-ribose pyrophosphatase